MTQRVAILLFAHEFGAVTLGAFRRLAEEAAAYGDLFVLNDGAKPAPPELAGRLHVFDFAEISRQVVSVLGDSIVPGNCHLAHLDFIRHHPDFEYVWVIEYDVRFSGSWATFFQAHERNHSDLLTCHLRTAQEEPGWFWWPTLSSPNKALPDSRCVRAFMPIQRLSRAALAEIDRQVRRGWVGHFEGLVPTVLSEAGMDLEDIGGNGGYVRAGNEDRFYSSASTPDGSLRGLGTMRFRPPVAFIGLRKDRLFHPVKTVGLSTKTLVDSVSWKTLFGSQMLMRRARAWIGHRNDEAPGSDLDMEG